VTTVAGTGRPGFKDGPGSLAQFNSPQGLRVDAQGVVWVADTFNHRIRRIDLDGTVSTVAGDGRPGMEDGPAMEARFSSPSGVQPDPSDGSLWVADTDNHAIRRILPDGTVVTVSGNGRPGFVDGTWADARFFRPFGFALDRRGDLYVADWGNEAVRVLHPWGTVETIAGGQQEGYRDGPALTAHLHGLMNVAVDENGLIYLADTDNERIRVVLP
jgi:DNA-binding beta-propeller fold protein YncE